MDLIGSALAPAEAAATRLRTTTSVQGQVASVPGGLPGSTVGRRMWQINCGDVVGRDRYLTVLVEHNKVVLVGPPGETAILSTSQLDQLRAALREAAEQAER